MLKTWLNYKVITALTTLLLLSGCVIVINQPSPEEKKLYSIQQNVGTQVKDVSQKVESGNYNPTDLETMISQVESSIQDGLNQINSLQIPEKAKLAAEKTKIYLESGQKILGQLKALTQQLAEIKAKGEAIGSKASALAQEQFQQIQNGINSFQTQLGQISQNIEQTGDQMMRAYNQSK